MTIVQSNFRKTVVKVARRTYTILTEVRCKAKVNYFKYYPQFGVKVDRRGNPCSRYTVSWCGMCGRHCQEFHDHKPRLRRKR